MTTQRDGPTLSNVERLLCEHLAAGDTYGMIAARYGLHPEALKWYARVLRDRFHAVSTTHLVDILRRTGRLDTSDH